MDGFESWKPCAPGVGLNSVDVLGNSVLQRAVKNRLTVVHQEARRFVVAVPALQGLVLRTITVLLVYEGASDSTSTRVHVLVSTPACKVDIPIVKLQLYVSCCVRQIPADDNSAGVGMRCDCRDVQQLAAVVLNAGQKNQRELVSMLVDQRAYALGGNDVALVGLDFEH